MNEKKMREERLPEWPRWLQLGVSDRECDGDGEHVRRHDLDETTPSKVFPRRRRVAGNLRKHKGIRNDEAAQEEKEVDADEPRFGQKL